MAIELFAFVPLVGLVLAVHAVVLSRSPRLGDALKLSCMVVLALAVLAGAASAQTRKDPGIGDSAFLMVLTSGKAVSSASSRARSRPRPAHRRIGITGARAWAGHCASPPFPATASARR